MSSRSSLPVLGAAVLCVVMITLTASAMEQSRTQSRGVPGVAGQSPQAWWHKYQKDLGLSADQVARVEEIFQTTMRSSKELRKELDRVEAQLSTLISSAHATEALVDQQADVVEAARSRLGKTRTMMLFRMRQVLTPDQRLKLDELHKHWQRQGPERRKDR